MLDDKDRSQVVKAKPLAKFLKLFSNEIRCVFLNSCHSVSQSKEICKYIPKVVCMSQNVPDETAIHFAAIFYKSIGAGKDIDRVPRHGQSLQEGAQRVETVRRGSRLHEAHETLRDILKEDVQKAVVGSHRVSSA